MMKLNEEILRMKSMMGINESMVDYIQKYINDSLNDMRVESEGFGLGEMDELDEIESIDDIKIVRTETDPTPIVFVDIHVNSNRKDFDNVLTTLSYDIGNLLPGVNVVLNDIVDNRTFGPGIDW
jgi:hypothetical protein